MGLTLYVETNFAVAIAKGQDPVALEILTCDTIEFQLVIPSICCMEAYSVWERDKKTTNQLIEKLSFHSREVSRDRSSPRAGPLARRLEESKIESEGLLYEVRDRLDETLERLALEAEFINLDHDIVHENIVNEYIQDPTDNLILCSVLWHARRHPADRMGFLSSNHHDFGEPEVLEVLRSAGIVYFKRSEAAWGWLGARPAREGPAEA